MKASSSVCLVVLVVVVVVVVCLFVWREGEGEQAGTLLAHVHINPEYALCASGAINTAYTILLHSCKSSFFFVNKSHARACMCVCVSVCVCVCVCAHALVCTCVHMCMFAYACLCVCDDVLVQ